MAVVLENEMDGLLDCICGTPGEVDFTGCTEFYGGTWQDVMVMCTGKCGYSVAITFDSDIEGQGEIVQKLAIDVWNKQMTAI